MPKSVLRSILYYVYSIYVHIYIPEKRSEVYIVLCIAYIFIFLKRVLRSILYYV